MNEWECASILGIAGVVACIIGMVIVSDSCNRDGSVSNPPQLRRGRLTITVGAVFAAPMIIKCFLGAFL